MSWQEAAACKGQAQWPWFPYVKYSEPFPSDDLAPAREFCDRCPVSVPCLAEGVASRSHGVWGGVLLRYGAPVPESPIRPRRRYSRTQTPRSNR